MTKQGGDFKKNRIMPMKCISFFLLLSFFLFQLGEDMALALPQGMSVVEGEVSTESPDSNSLVITASDHAILNFHSFSIAKNEMVRFIQPSETASVLSRVTGDSSSDIYGSLFANGELVLVNPNNITFHAGADVQVRSLIASTLEIQNAMYLNNQLTFEKQLGSNLGKILNEANIAVNDKGHIALLAEQVQQKGTLTANLGSVVLASGEKQTLSFDSQGLINLVIDEGLKESLPNAIDNQGTIQAGSGKVLLTAKTLNAPLDTLINSGGILEATEAVVGKDGTVEFISNGTIETRGRISASNLRISEGATLNAHDTQFTIEKDWVDEGTFNGQNSSVEFKGPSDSRILGDNVFHNLTVVTPDKEVKVEAGRTLTVTGSLDIVGSPDVGAEEYYVKIWSTEGGAQWFLNLETNDYFLERVRFTDTYSLKSLFVPVGIDGGNNFNLEIDPVWDGGGADNNWSTQDNWDGNAVPVNSEAVTFSGDTGTYGATG